MLLNAYQDDDAGHVAMSSGQQSGTPSKGLALYLLGGAGTVGMALNQWPGWVLVGCAVLGYMYSARPCI